MNEYYECDRCDNEVSIYDENCGQCGTYLSRYQAPVTKSSASHKVVEYRELNEGSAIMVTLNHSRNGRVVYIVPAKHQIARRAYYCMSGGQHESMETGVLHAERMFEESNFNYMGVDIGQGRFMAYVHNTL